jgi:hypothetical protein
MSACWRRGGSLKSTKTGASAKLLPMHPSLKHSLQESRSQSLYNKPEDFVFPSERLQGSKPLDLASVSKKKIQPASGRIGVTGVGWHTFRHSVGTMLADMGEHQLMIREYLRHSNLHVTNKYLQATTTCVRRIAASSAPETLPQRAYDPLIRKRPSSGSIYARLPKGHVSAGNDNEQTAGTGKAGGCDSARRRAVGKQVDPGPLTSQRPLVQPNSGDKGNTYVRQVQRAYRTQTHPDCFWVFGGLCRPFKRMAGTTGLEPAASAVTGQQRDVTD